MDSIQHISFIIDGNRRWAKKNGKAGFLGHKRGYEKVQEISLLLNSLELNFVTYYMFSKENWNRSESEISYLMNLLRNFFSKSKAFFKKHNMRFLAIGDFTKLPIDISEKINELKSFTQRHTGLTIVIAISYSGRDEIIRASKKIIENIKNGKTDISALNENLFSQYLDTANIPNPDILIRTSEKRISNFLLWQSAYSEIFFIDKLWPEFDKDDLMHIIDEFSKRERRYGK